jgi:nicotinamidase-related amidase
MEALLLIDVQLNMFEPDPCHDSAQLLARLIQLRQAAARAGIPVVFIRNNGGDGEPDEPGVPGWAIHPELCPATGDAIIDKVESDAFSNPDLAIHLERLGVDTVTIAGLQSEFCVHSTALGAQRDGLGVIVASDGHSTFDGSEPARSTIDQINQELRSFANLQTCASIELRWEPA